MAIAHWFIAAFYGTCSGCGDDIMPNTMVRPDGHGGHQCEVCGYEEDDYCCDC